ncbi:MAG: hypothetical protein LBE07_08150 [Gordonia sp. (in: high G+C Gram-positive bacteria)]|jgi:hypothetical protein|nr:hypothetical protein [Gordonia sp. (in: high G+C Gram-positive bacteria)]
MWPADRYGIVHRDVALDSGFSERDIATALRDGVLARVARGRYVPTDQLGATGDPRDELYRLTCIAVATGPGQPVLSHDSAAAVHRLKLLYPDRTHVHVTTGREGGGSRRARRVIHGARLGQDDVVEVDGVRVTSVARTAADIALSTAKFPQALTAFDAALRAGGDTEAITRFLECSRRGVSAARRALGFADGRSESPGESWSRAQMIEGDLPVPDLQVEYALRDGSIARCDFGIDDVFVGEFDGLVKYRRDMRGGDNPEDVVIREKIREDRLRDLDLDVRRWIWDDLRGNRLVPMLRRRYEALGIRCSRRSLTSSTSAHFRR